MNKGLYPRLAFQNIKKNAKLYIPYLLTCILTIGMYYIIDALARSKSILNLRGGEYIQSLMLMGTFVVALFAVIFLFYTHSFLMKRRKKEIGLYNILGMEKRHIAIMFAFETGMIALVSLGLGLLFGILFYKLVLLILIKIVAFDVQFGFEISIVSIRYTCILFVLIFLATLLNQLRQIHLSSPIELLKGSNVGEKEPKGSWLITLIGILSLGGGYALAVLTDNSMFALVIFFPAVILVIIGTYCLFISGSITLLKLLKKNKRFYYKTNHFISVSGMIYRMKQNAVGLANICILSTMVLVMISSTSWLYGGVEETVTNRYPREIVAETEHYEDVVIDVAMYQQAAQQAANQNHAQVSNELYYEYITVGGLRQGNNMMIDPSEAVNFNQKDLAQLYFLPIYYYNLFYDESATLSDDEMLVFGVHHTYDGSSFTIFNRTYQIKEELADFDAIGTSSANMVTSYICIVSNDQFEWLHDQLVATFAASESASMKQFMYAFDVQKENEITQKIANDLSMELQAQIRYDENLQQEVALSHTEVYDRNVTRVELQSMFGGFFFLGIFLGSLFIMATVLIMYYKQISEGYEDKERFIIMQKVGMSHAEVSKTVHSQVLLVFFMPLVVAGIHICFAFNLIYLLFGLVSMNNAHKFMISTFITYLIFAFFYIVVYLMTAKVYEKLVSQHD